ncbi:MAG: ArnT family glycosyltransferase, partial [Endomicrobiia bacterium]
MNKKDCFLLIGFLLFYLLISFLYFRISDIAHVDGFWYLKLAENIAKGNGLIENVTLYFYPKLPILKKFPHPIGVYWNPLNSIILSGIYKIFGISEFTSRLGVLIIDALVLIFIYWLCIKLYPENKWIAFFSSMIFILHPFILGMRGLSGMPESYDLFFITLFCYFLYKSITVSEKYFLFSGLFGGLAYLSRNEGIWTLPTMIVTFLLVKYAIKNNQKIHWKFLLVGIIIFLITISPWEIRNRILFGNQANIMKKNLLFTTEYFDLWRYGKVFSFKEYISSGFTNLVLRRIASFYYKSITFMDMLTWPLGLFLLWG